MVIERMYVVVLRKLSAGLKAAQACHAMTAFTFAYPRQTQDWFENSNNLVVLQCDDLPQIADELERQGLAVARFHEPDRDGELTAICTEPGARKVLGRVALADSDQGTVPG